MQFGKAFAVGFHLLLQFTGRRQKVSAVRIFCGVLQQPVQILRHFPVPFVFFQNRVGYMARNDTCKIQPAEKLFLVDAFAHQDVKLLCPLNVGTKQINRLRFRLAGLT